jgi:hypothetical protein
VSILPIPSIKIYTEPAKLSIDGDLGQYDMKQPRPGFELEQPKAKMEIQSPRGDLEIDQSKAWDALGLANNLEVMSRIYSQAPNIALQGIAKIVEDGNKMGDLRNRSNVIADLAQEVKVSFPEFDYVGEASYDNVDIHYTAHKAEINVTPSEIVLNAKVNNPQVEYKRGKLDIYVQNYGKIEITPPQVDTKY